MSQDALTKVRAPNQPPSHTLTSSGKRNYRNDISVQDKTERPSLSQDFFTKARAPTQPLSQLMTSSGGRDYRKGISVQGKNDGTSLSLDAPTKARVPNQPSSRKLSSSEGRDYGSLRKERQTLLVQGRFDKSRNPDLVFGWRGYAKDIFDQGFTKRPFLSPEALVKAGAPSQSSSLKKAGPQSNLLL